MIFESGDAVRIERVVAAVGTLGCPELQTFVMSKFLELIELGRSREAGRVLSNHSVSNYHSLSHGGLSATFTRLLASKSPTQLVEQRIDSLCKTIYKLWLGGHGLHLFEQLGLILPVWISRPRSKTTQGFFSPAKS